MVVEELEPFPPVRWTWTRRQLRQAFLNIIKNSFDAMPEGGKLTVSTSRKNGQVEITIADTGRGIPEENQELVFTPFFSTKHGGTGLGLPITSHIIQEHRGTIGFESYPDWERSLSFACPCLAFDGVGGDGTGSRPRRSGE